MQKKKKTELNSWLFMEEGCWREMDLAMNRRNVSPSKLLFFLKLCKTGYFFLWRNRTHENFKIWSEVIGVTSSIIIISCTHFLNFICVCFIFLIPLEKASVLHFIDFCRKYTAWPKKSHQQCQTMSCWSPEIISVEYDQNSIQRPPVAHKDRVHKDKSICRRVQSMGEKERFIVRKLR